MKNSVSRIAILVLLAAFLVPVSALAVKGTAKGKGLGKKQPPPPVTAPVASVHFCSSDITPNCDPVDNAFSINVVRDITIFTSWQNVTGAHVQKLVLIMPNGDPYQAMSTNFDTTTGQGLQGIDPPTIANVLPISGTWIQQRAIVGAWKVQVFLDDVYITEVTLNLY